MISRRILLVDDSPEFLRSAEHFLSAASGFEVVGRAVSGKEAIKQAHRLRPDLVLIDVAMPGMNGLEATRQIKTNPAAPHVILVTMHDSPEYRAAAAAAGADGFVAKPEFGVRLLPLLESLFNDPPVVVPIDGAAEAAAKPVPAAPRILVVQHRLTDRRFLTTLLESAGYGLLEASDAAEALDMVRVERPDLVLTGVLMPAMDGFQLVREIRRAPASSAPPVIFYTGSYEPDEVLGFAQSLGVGHVLSKGTASETILAAVKDALTAYSQPAVALADADFERAHQRLVNDKLCEKAIELEAANQRLAAIIELGQQLSQETKPSRLLDNFCHTARHILGARYAFLGLRSDDGLPAQPFRTSGLDPEIAAQLGLETARPRLLRRLLTERLTPAPTELSVGRTGLDEPPERTALRIFLVVPLASGTRVYGWLYLVDKLGAGEFTPQDERLALTLCGQAAVTLENARRSEELAQRAAELEQGAAERRRARIELEMPAHSGCETVLVAEDDDLLRPMLRALLLHSGYQVLQARHGGHALRLCEQHPGPIHLMLTDVVMPEMNGRQLADRLAALRPEMKVLYMSGYIDDTVYRTGMLQAGRTFLHKPFSPNELIGRVRELLDQ